MASFFESLTLKLANVLKLAAQDQGSLTPQAKQALVRSVSKISLVHVHRTLRTLAIQTKDFKDALKEANDHATSLPGGDHSMEEQDEVIEMLEKLKERKRFVVLHLSSLVFVTQDAGNSWPNSQTESVAYPPLR